MSTVIVRAACPHDCPDTCAMRVTVTDGVAIKVQGDPDHPPTHGALCTKVSRYPERTYHAERVLHPLKRVGPKGSGRYLRVSWDEALADIAQRLKAIAARHSEAIVPYSYAGTMGLLQGESMAARFFHRLGASGLDRTICANAGGDALEATFGGKVGMHTEHFAESRLLLIWGSNSVGSNLHFWTLAQAAKRAGAKLVCIDPRRTENGRQVPSAHRADAGHRWRAGARPDARADRARLAGPRLHRTPHRRLAGPARTRAAMGARAHGAGLRHLRRGGARSRTRLRHDAARSDPPELRHAARARRRQRGAPDRHPAGTRGRVAAARGRDAAVELGLVQALHRCRGAGAAGPAEAPRRIHAPAAHDQHEHDRRRPAARSLTRFRAEDRGAGRLQQQPGRGGSRVAEGGARLRARGPVHRGARTLHDRHRRPRRLRAARHHATRTPRRPPELRPHPRDDQRGRGRAGGRGQTEHPDLPRAGGAHGFRRPVLCRYGRSAGPRRLPRAGAFRRAARARLGQAAAARSAVRERRVPERERQVRDRLGRLRRARPRAEPRIGGQHARAGAALSARDDFAPGAQLPQLQLRQREEPARHRRRAAAGDPSVRRGAARHQLRPACARVQ